MSASTRNGRAGAHKHCTRNGLSVQQAQAMELRRLLPKLTAATMKKAK